MNNDLISRSELKRKLHNFFDGKTIVEPAYILRDVFYYIDNAPTIDKGYDFGYADGHGEGYELGKNSRPQGKWIIDTDTRTMKCNRCGAVENADRLLVEDMNYCHCCGANMRKGGAE